MFDALEKARVEALGARAMARGAGQSGRAHRGPDARRSHRPRPHREEVPLATAVGLHRARAADRRGAAQGGARRARAGRRLDRGEGRRRSRRAGADARRPGGLCQLVAAAARGSRPGRGAGPGRAGARDGGDEERGRGRAARRGRRRGRRGDAGGRRNGEARRGAARRRRTTRAGAEEMEPGEQETLRRRRGERERPGRAPGGAIGTCRRRPTTRPSPPASTRSSRPTICATRRSWAGCAPISTSRSPSAERRHQARQPAAAAADGAAVAQLGFRPGGRAARCRAAGAGHRQPGPFAELQGRARHRVPRHGRHPADRQYGLDARPADLDRGDLRRHPRPHARALRRQDRNPRLHHPRLEGRAEPREMAGRRPAAAIRAGSTTCATSSTSAPTSPGATRAATSA